ncbi:unnamed protein product [Ixodes pacificus]
MRKIVSTELHLPCLPGSLGAPRDCHGPSNSETRQDLAAIVFTEAGFAHQATRDGEQLAEIQNLRALPCSVV